MGSNRTTAEGSPRQASPLQGAMKRAQPVPGQESNPDTPRAPPRPPVVARVMGKQSESESDSPPQPPLVARVMGMQSESDSDSPPRPPLVARVMGKQSESDSDSETRQEFHSDDSPRAEPLHVVGREYSQDDGTELPTSARDDVDGSQVHSGTVATPPRILFADSAKPKPHPRISL